jgi:hypothetical protein
VNAEIRNMKADLLKEFDLLDIKYESGGLLPGQKDRMNTILLELENIWNMEEIKAKERSRDRNIKGDRNTAYFQAIANQRNRKKRIPCLETSEGVVENNTSMLNHDVEFYKSLFRDEPISGVSLEDTFWGEDDKINTQEKESLEMPFSKEEIKKAIFES